MTTKSSQKAKTIRHERVQHAVGQGGFHSGSVSIGEETFTYVYDCGSNQLSRLNEEVRAFADSTEKVDALFLSHMDFDHVSGLDALLGSVKVDTVFLPYLTIGERIALVSEAASRVPTQAAFLEFLEWPSYWLADRGVRRVVLVHGAEGDGPVQVPESTAPENQQPRAGVDLDLDQLRAASPEEIRETGGDAKATVTSIDSSIVPVVAAGRPVWLLVPFVHPEPTKTAAFVTAVQKEWSLPRLTPKNLKTWMEYLRSGLRSRDFRDRLSDLYGLIRKDRNLTSMSLLSAPPDSVDAVRRSTWGGRYNFYPHRLESSKCGWLGTGDAHLDRANRAKALEGFYGSLMDRIGTIVLPHHGAHRSISEKFISRYPDKVWVAAYGPNNYDHPAKSIVRAANRNGTAIRVTANSASSYVEQVTFEIP